MTKAKQKMLDACLSLLKEQSCDSIMVKDITSRAAVTKATFYNNFKSKQDLLLLLCKERLDASLQTLHEEGWDAFMMECFTLGKEQGAFLEGLGNASGVFWDFIHIYFSSLLKSIRATCTAQADITEKDDMIIDTYVNSAIYLFRRWGIADPPAPLESIMEVLDTYLPNDFLVNADFSSLSENREQKGL